MNEHTRHSYVYIYIRIYTYIYITYIHNDSHPLHLRGDEVSKNGKISKNGRFSKKRECLSFLLFWVQSWCSCILTTSYFWTDWEFTLIMSVFFPDNYPCSTLTTLEQCWCCGANLFDLFKGCNIGGILLGYEQNCKSGDVKRRRSNIKGGWDPLPTKQYNICIYLHECRYLCKYQPR